MPGLKDLIDGIESTESESAQLQTKIDRLTELIDKQKRLLADKDAIIVQQQGQAAQMTDIPDDVYELRDLIGTQRARLNETESNLEHAKAELVQVKRELELTSTRLGPTEQKLNATLETIGQLKTELAQKRSELMVRNETVATLSNKVSEMTMFSKTLQEEREKLLDDMRDKSSAMFDERLNKYIKQIEDLKMENIDKIQQVKSDNLEKIEEIRGKALEEKASLKAELNRLESIVLDSKLESTEAGSTAKDLTTRFGEMKSRSDELINKVDELNKQLRYKEEDMKRLNTIVDSLSTWKHENVNKISYFDRLTMLMEQEAQFKTFLVVMEVGQIAIEDLQKALGAPIVLVRKYVQKLQDFDLIEVNELGKIVVRTFEEEE